VSNKTIVVTGGTGFIGRHFLADLPLESVRVRALSRNPEMAAVAHPGIEWVVGDLADPDSWKRLLEPGCTVVNLAYSSTGTIEHALASTTTMVKVCAEMKIARLVHCSTISVYGRTEGGVIDELTPCRPIDDYGRRKLEIEQAVQSQQDFELLVLRPSAVFGSGGQGLRALCSSLKEGSRLTNYIRSSLFGSRQMHLVRVETVVAALHMLCNLQHPVDREVFIVAEDQEPHNNFRDVERLLMSALGVPDYPVAPLPIPSAVLRLMLRARGRSEVDPNCIYSASKLQEWGFTPSQGFSSAIQRFAQIQPGKVGASI
jgi:nucleoside-diphosphate-sugar epimerase